METSWTNFNVSLISIRSQEASPRGLWRYNRVEWYMSFTTSLCLTFKESRFYQSATFILMFTSQRTWDGFLQNGYAGENVQIATYLIYLMRYYINHMWHIYDFYRFSILVCWAVYILGVQAAMEWFRSLNLTFMILKAADKCKNCFLQ